MKTSLPLARTTLISVAAGVLIAFLLISLPAAAQELTVSGIAADGTVSVEQLDSAIESVEAREGLDDETRNSIVEQLRDAQAQVRNRLAAEAAATLFAEALNTAPVETEALRNRLDVEVPATPTVESLGITDDTTLADLTHRLSQELAEQLAAESRAAELETQIQTQESRPAEMRTRINELRSSREELATLIQITPPPGEQQLLSEARRLNTELRGAAQGAEIDKLEQELVSHSVRLSLLKVQLDITRRSRLQVDRRVDLLQEQVNQKRQADADLAQRSAAVAELAAADKHPAVRSIAEANANLTRELPSIVASIDQTTTRIEQARSQASNLEQRLARSRQRLEVAGLNRAIGLLLVEESRNIPQVSQYRAQMRARRNTLSETGLAQVRTREQLREMTTVDARVDEIMQDVAADVTDEDELAAMRSEVLELLRNKRDLLFQLENTYSSYLQLLGDLEMEQRRLLDMVAEYREFLGQNMLWIPSAPIIFMGDWTDISSTTVAALSLNNWLAAAVDVVDSLGQHPLEAAFALLLLAGLIVTRKPLTNFANTTNAKVGRLSTDSISLTLTAIGIAAIRAAPLPIFLGMAGFFLSIATGQSEFSSLVAQGLIAVVPFLYNLRLFRVLSAQDGVLHIHFGWQEKNLAIVRRQLDRMVTIGVPLVFATVVLYASESAFDRATLGRLMFIALMVVLTLSFRPLAHPESGVAASYYQRHADNWVSKLRWLWYILAVGIPVSLVALSMLGFLYTSLILTSLIVDTIWLGLVLIVINLVVLRWLALTRRKLALRILEEEREAEEASRENELEPEAEGELPVVEPEPLDLDEVDAQTRKLLGWGLLLVAVIVGWGIWSEVFPAFRLLDQVSLWSQTIVVDGVETIVPVTLANVLLAVLVAAGTVVASRNLPGLMEIAILQHLTLEPGSRYATITLVRYVVVTVGTVSVLNIIGWNWSQIQWLVAALSVGLGFGLQEIVANFVSGLIILFERPVRVGDTVTVGQLSGTVSRVQIRATTITDWDRKEIIVPNKAFITEQVINWTLADPITRIVVEVGISYGSDVERAQEVMLKTLQSLPLVLEDPPPKVFFLGFGDSSLDFKLFVHLRQLSERLPLTHSVHEEILKALREHGIEIPFPQRDLHLRSTVEGKDD